MDAGIAKRLMKARVITAYTEGFNQDTPTLSQLFAEVEKRGYGWPHIIGPASPSGWLYIPGIRERDKGLYPEVEGNGATKEDAVGNALLAIVEATP